MNWILLVAAIVVSLVVFTWLVRVVKSTIGTAIAIAIVVLVLQIVFGIGPSEFWEEVVTLWKNLWQHVQR